MTSRDPTLKTAANVCEGTQRPTDVVVDDEISRADDSFIAFGPAITVAWVASDLESFTPAFAPLLQLREATFTISASGGYSTELSQPSPNGLTTQSKVGIGVGVTTGVVLAIVITVEVVLLLADTSFRMVSWRPPPGQCRLSSIFDFAFWHGHVIF